MKKLIYKIFEKWMSDPTLGALFIIVGIISVCVIIVIVCEGDFKFVELQLNKK